MQLWQTLRGAMQKKRIRQLIYICIVLLSIAFMAYAIKNNWAQLKSQSWQINAIYAILGIILIPIGHDSDCSSMALAFTRIQH